MPDCCTCGACCVGHGSPVWANIEDDEQVPIPDIDIYWLRPIDWWDEETRGIATKRVLHPRGGMTTACTCLDGTLGKEVSCRIYEHRPRVCREWQPGSDYCVKARRQLGVE